jgi:hypothetical protein
MDTGVTVTVTAYLPTAIAMNTADSSRHVKLYALLFPAILVSARSNRRNLPVETLIPEQKGFILLLTIVYVQYRPALP